MRQRDRRREGWEEREREKGRREEGRKGG